MSLRTTSPTTVGAGAGATTSETPKAVTPFWSNLSQLRLALVAAALVALVAIVWALWASFRKPARGGGGMFPSKPTTHGFGPDPRRTVRFEDDPVSTGGTGAPGVWVPPPGWISPPCWKGDATPPPPKVDFEPASVGGGSQPSRISDDDVTADPSTDGASALEPKNTAPSVAVATARNTGESTRHSSRRGDGSNSALDRDMREMTWRKQPKQESSGFTNYPETQRQREAS